MPYSVGTAYLQVVPSFLHVERAVKKEAEKLGTHFERAAADHLHQGLRTGGRDGGADAARAVGDAGGPAGDRFGRNFLNFFRRRTSTAGRGRPVVEVDADTSHADRKLVELRRSASDHLREGIRTGGRAGGAAAAREVGDAGRPAGDRFGREFSDIFRRHTVEAAASMPDVEVDANTSRADRKLAELRRALLELGDRRIEVDVDIAEALGDVELIRQELERLSREDPNIRVRASTHVAMAEIAALQAQVNHLDRDDVNIKVDVNSAGAAAELTALSAASNATLGHLGRIIAIASFLGPMLVPAAAASAAAFTGLAQAAGAAAAGIGVAVLAVSGIPGALSALSAAEDDAAKSAEKVSTSHLAMASALDQVRAAEAGLANTIINNAEQKRSAALRVADAERTLTEQQRQARQAQQALNEARREAKRALEDLKLQLEANSLAQRQALLDEADARRDLDEILANPLASDEEQEQARINFEQAQLRIRELEVRQKRLAAEKRRSDRTGIEGSRQVVAAHERVRRATEQVARAQRQVTEATRAQATQQRRAAMALEQAHRSVASAQRAMERATISAGDTGTAAMFKLRNAMEGLSPAGREFALFVFGLRDEFLTLRRTAEAGFLPGFQRSIQMLLPYLPRIRGFIGDVAAELGRLAVAGVRALQSPFWRDFFGFVRDTTVPALRGMARFIGLAGAALAGLVKAFGPLNANLGQGLINLMERFARWATTLETNQGFAKFVAFVEESGPKVMRLLGQMLEFVGRLLIAAAPIGVVLVEAFGGMFEFLNKMPIGVLTVLVGLIVGISGALLLLSITTRTYTVLTNAWGTAVGFVSAAKGRLTSLLVAYSLAAAGATTTTGRLSAAMLALGGAVRSTARSKLGFLTFLGGPWGVVLAAATLAVGGLMTASANYRNTVDGLRQALVNLGDVYRDLEGRGGRATAATEDALRNIINANPDMQQAVITLAEMGVTFDELGAAAARNDFGPIMRRLDEEIAATEARWKDQSNFLLTSWTSESRATHARLQHLRQVRAAMGQSTDAMETQTRAQEILNQATEQEIGLQRALANTMGPTSLQARQKLIDVYNTNADRIRALTAVVAAFGDAEATAAQKADAMRMALDQQTSSAIAANEAAEDYNSQLLSLSEAVDSNGASLAINTREGLRNRDALQAVALAAREMYLQDIAAGKPMDEVTNRHRDRIEALREEARRLGLAAEETDKLIKQYGEIDPRVETVYTTEGFDKVFNELRMLQFIQDALERGVPLEQARREWQELQIQQRRVTARRHGALEFAEGGPIRGPGTATSDDIPIWASDGEYMQPADSVDYYGVEAMEAIRRKQLPRWLFAPGFARGGRITKVPIEVYVGDTKMPTLDRIVDRHSRPAPPAFAGTAGMGWEKQMEVLRAAFPGLALYSGYRPGDTTSSGSTSYHAVGRAVDLPPRMDVFNWIAKNYADSREIIFSPAGSRQIWNGRPHLYTGSVVQEHFDHVHWAYDQGGYLPPGLSLAYNGTGQPEPILTNNQWQTMANLVDGRSQVDSPNVYQFSFRDTTLTPAKLRSIQERDAALARAGRAV